MRGTNVWRSFGHHKLLRQAATSLYGEEVADLHFRTAIGNVVRTRWGTFEGPERTYLRGHLGAIDHIGQKGIPPMVRARMLPLRRRQQVAHPRPSESQPIGDAIVPVAEEAMPFADEPPGHKQAPRDVLIDWARIHMRALRIEREAPECDAVDLDIDGENKAIVLRVRARRTHEDLQSRQFWVKMIVAHISRTPLSHALNRVQAYKGEPRGDVEKGGGSGML